MSVAETAFTNFISIIPSGEIYITASTDAPIGQQSWGAALVGALLGVNSTAIVTGLVAKGTINPIAPGDLGIKCYAMARRGLRLLIFDPAKSVKTAALNAAIEANWNGPVKPQVMDELHSSIAIGASRTCAWLVGCWSSVMTLASLPWDTREVIAGYNQQVGAKGAEVAAERGKVSGKLGVAKPKPAVDEAEIVLAATEAVEKLDSPAFVKGLSLVKPSADYLSWVAIAKRIMDGKEAPKASHLGMMTNLNAYIDSRVKAGLNADAQPTGKKKKAGETIQRPEWN
jgi:hypothetical protein